MTFDFEWAELPDDIAHRKQQAWQEWEATDTQLHDPDHPLPPDEQAELERRHRAAWKQYWHADGARYHLSNRQMGDAITVMERSGMARRVPTPPIPKPADYGARSQEYDDWLDASDRGHPTQPSAELADYLDALDRHQRANYDAHVIPVHKLWTNDGWLLTPDELAAALPHAPATATDRRQRVLPLLFSRPLTGLASVAGERLRIGIQLAEGSSLPTLELELKVQLADVAAVAPFEAPGRGDIGRDSRHCRHGIERHAAGRRSVVCHDHQIHRIEDVEIAVNDPAVDLLRGRFRNDPFLWAEEIEQSHRQEQLLVRCGNACSARVVLVQDFAVKPHGDAHRFPSHLRRDSFLPRGVCGHRRSGLRHGFRRDGPGGALAARWELGPRGI